ncbi:MAG: hypothetical protein KF771_07880 [Burkholderiales bacterium]|nr:hypothetical protein [Burkholderiales bacterium]
MLRTAALLLLIATTAQAQEFSFDASQFEKKPFEFGGYIELKQQRLELNRDAALYQLGFYRQPHSRLDQTTLTLKPEGKLRSGAFTLSARAHAEGNWETRQFDREFRFDELYGSYKPDPGFTLDAGKIPLKWGKGYAWNPVGFVERQKDPNDPDLARQGFTILAADWIRNFDGDLRTVALTPVLLPVTGSVNADFGSSGHLNAAAKLYLLYKDTDIDFMFLSNGNRSRRYGVDFSRNIGSNLEIHGEWARIEDTRRQVVDAAGTATTLAQNAVSSYLLGLRYLTERDTTWILEYYRNGSGYREEEMQDFFRYVDTAYAQFLNTGNDNALRRASNLSRSGVARPNPGRNYVYLRASQKEPFDILYFTPALTLIANADDRSFSVAPEILYTGITNLELKIRAFFLSGNTLSEFGERPNRRRIELQARLYF